MRCDDDWSSMRREFEGGGRILEGRLLRHLESLLALARTRHFGEAASVLGVSQPAFSQSIRALEGLLGVSMVRRTRRFEGFTPEGELVLQFARRMVSIVGELRGSLSELREAGGGELRIGSSPATLFSLPLLSEALKLRLPNCTLRVEEGAFEELAGRLRAGQLIAALTHAPPAPLPALELIPLYNESYAVIVPHSMEAGARRPVPWSSAAALPLGLPPTSAQFRRNLDAIFDAADARPRIAIESDSFLSLLAQAAIGACAVIVPAVFRAALPAPAGTRALRLAEAQVRRPVCIALSKARAAEAIGANLRQAASLMPALAAAALEAADSP